MGNAAISLINITHLMDALRKAKLIDEAAISVQWLDHYFYYASEAAYPV